MVIINAVIVGSNQIAVIRRILLPEPRIIHTAAGRR